MQTGDWIKLATAIIALLALVRPEIEGFIRRRRGSLQVLLNTGVEVGFSAVGHTVAVEGTLRANGDAFFVLGSSVLVKRSDGEELLLQWSGFRPRRVVATLNPTDQSILAPAPIEVRRGGAEHFNIVYSDLETKEKIQNILQPLRQESGIRLQQAGVFALSPEESQTAVKREEMNFLNDLHESGRFDVIAGQIKKSCFWRPDRYAMRVSFSVAGRETLFHSSCEFRLTDAQAQRLQDNGKILLFQNAGQFYMRLAFEESAQLPSRTAWK